MGQFLAGMGDRFHVDDRHRRVFRERPQHHVLAVVGPVDELREGAHADQIDIAAQHLRHFLDVLLGVAVHDRAEVELDRPGVLARLQHDGVAAQLEGAQLEAGAGAHGGVEEHQGDGLALERIAQPVLLVQRGLRQQRVEVTAGPVLGIEEVAKAHRGSCCGGEAAVAGNPENRNPARGRVCRRNVCNACDSLPGRGSRQRSARARGHAGGHAGAGQDVGVGADAGHGELAFGRPDHARKHGAMQHDLGRKVKGGLAPPPGNAPPCASAQSAGATVTRTRMRSPGS